MKNLLTKMIFIAIATIITTTSIFAQSGDERRLAVLDFKAGAGVVQADAEGISSMLISSLFDTHAFTLIERTQINAAIKEKGFQKDELTTQQISQLGKILGVKKVIVGDVTNVFGSYNVDARIIDVTTGVIESSAGETVAMGQIRRAMQTLGCKLTQRIVTGFNCEEKSTASGGYSNSADRNLVKSAPCLDLRDSKDRIFRELQRNDFANYKKFRTGNSLNKAGTGLLIPGLILAGGGLITMIAGAATDGYDEDGYYSDNSGVIIAGGVLFGFGTTFVITSIPLKVVGKNLRKKALRDYNKNCDNYADINLNLYGNGAGLAIKF